MSEFEHSEEKETGEPTTEEIFEAVKNDIPEEDLEPMREACEDDIEMIRGAIFTYMMEMKGMSEEDAENYLMEKGILEKSE